MAHTGSIKDGPGRQNGHAGPFFETRFRPRKKLGQHFLVDNTIIQKIVGSSGFRESDVVLEIGPGRGALTIPLSREVKNIVAVEKDPYLAGLLEKRLAQRRIDSVRVVHADILRWSFKEVESLCSQKIKVIGNLPYNISSPLLEKLMKNRSLIARAVLMFQLEVGRRLTASPGGKEYGAMTLLVQYHARSTLLFEVPKEAFYPRPKVDSTVIELDFERPRRGHSVREPDFKKVVKGAFLHRRKTIINSLSVSTPTWNRDMVSSALKKCEIDAKRRAETLDMAEFLCLARALSLTNG